MVQSFNAEGILFFPYARFMRKELAIPHLQMKNISQLDPKKLKKAGIRAVVFDKDNTLTEPYALIVHPSIRKSLASFRKEFGKNLAILSNSAGSADDNAFRDAKNIEKSLGISVIRHKKKKPSCIDEVEMHFGIKREEIACIGDRLFTDTVFGNRYGMLTILVEPFTHKRDNWFAKMLGLYERKLLEKWEKKGMSPLAHPAQEKLA